MVAVRPPVLRELRPHALPGVTEFWIGDRAMTRSQTFFSPALEGGCPECPPASLVPSTRPLQPCGTFAAYKRHRKAGETPCEACRAASAERSRRRYHDPQSGDRARKLKQYRERNPR
ncbi:hypothetical protein GCM10010530_14160 [Kribbella aluminosa]